MKACFAHQMRQIDEAAMNVCAIPGIVLMENAALSCVNEIKNTLTTIKDKRFSVFCGNGNNGGDGFAIARHLINNGALVDVYTLSENSFKGDALTNFRILRNMNAHIVNIDSNFNFATTIPLCDMVIDAILGTGIKGALKDEYAWVIDNINTYSGYTLSVDVPSGINSDTGEVCTTCIKANKTVTLAHYKVGLLMYPAADFTGEIKCVDISIPDYISNSVGATIDIIDNELFIQNMPKRRNNSHKGDYGKLLIVGASKGLTGAAYLSSQAAMLCGNGLVTLAIPDCVNDILEAKTTETMTFPLKSIDGHIAYDCADDILEKAKNCNAILIGPGMGTSDDAQKLVEKLILTSTIPLILDADAINCIAKNINILNNSKSNITLTPHSVEFSRLTRLSLNEIEKNRVKASYDFATKYGVTLILKGSRTIVTSKDGMQYINITGNPGLATGGSGDILAGMVASFISRGVNSHIACAMAVYLHGICGDVASSKYGEESVIASSILNCIPNAYNQILQLEK